MGFQITDKGSHLEVAMQGFVSVDETRQHFARLSALLAKQRARLGLARVVVDTSLSQAQSPEVASLLRENTSRLYEDRDRVAVYVSSPLLRMQIRRVLTTRVFPTFTCPAEAESYAAS